MPKLQPLTLNTVYEPTTAACPSQAGSMAEAAASAPVDDVKPSGTTADTLTMAVEPGRTIVARNESAMRREGFTKQIQGENATRQKNAALNHGIKKGDTIQGKMFNNKKQKGNNAMGDGQWPGACS